MSLSEEQLIANYENYKNLLTTSTGQHRSSPLTRLIDHFDDRLVLCPASSKINFHNCFPGGLIDHSLRVLRCARRLSKAYGDGVPLPSDESIVFAALLHDFGKIGDLQRDRYTPQTNNYYRERGNLYEVDQNMMTVSHSSLFLLQHFEVTMDRDEWLAILLADGPSSDEGKHYSMSEPPLALLIHQADRLACELEKKS